MIATRKQSGLIKLHERVDGPQLIFMPMRNGTVFYAKSIATLLGPEIGTYGLRPLPETLAQHQASSIRSIARIFAHDIVEQLPYSEIYLFGYSFGGIFAFETGRALEELGKKVECVWIGDTDISRFSTIPMLFLRNPHLEILQLLRFLKYNFRSYVLPSDDPNIVRSYRFRYPFNVGVEPASYHWITRELIRAAGRYSASPWREAPLILLKATKDDQGTCDLGWQRLVGSNMRIVTIDAWHGTMMEQAHPLAQIVTEIRREALGEP